jgi:hypothetical protein
MVSSEIGDLFSLDFFSNQHTKYLEVHRTSSTSKYEVPYVEVIARKFGTVAGIWRTIFMAPLCTCDII